MSVSGQTLQTSVSQYEVVTCPSRQSCRTGLSSKTRDYDRRVFHQFYPELCERRSLLPMACSRVQSKQAFLDFNADRIKLSHWGPLLTALCADRSLHHVAIRSKYFKKKVVGSADTKLKAVAVAQCPVLYTHYVLSLLMDALCGTVQRSRALVSLELDSLPLSKEYITSLMEAMKSSTSLQHLSLQGCPIGDAGCEVVCASVRNVPSIVSLNLSQCELSCAGAAHISSLLEYQKIQRMSEAWKHTLRYREANFDVIQGIRRVTLNNNTVQDQGLFCLVDAVTDDLWLKALDLQSCGLSDVGASRILEMLEYNTNLAIVDVRVNPGISADLLGRIMRKLHSNNIHQDPQFGWFPVKMDQASRKKSQTQSIASRFRLQLSKKTLLDVDEHRRCCEQRKPPVPCVRLKQRVPSFSKSPPTSPHAPELDDYRRLEEERDLAVQQRNKALAELEKVRKERDEALRTVDGLLAGQPRAAEGYTLVRQDVFTAMEAIVKLLHKNGYRP